MIRNKEDFYQALWEDYISFEEKDRDKSFIYGYLKKKKDYRAEVIGQDREALYQYSKQKKRDKYTMLKGAYIAFTENGIITEQEYTEIFKELIGKPDKASGKLAVPAKYENLSGRNDIDNAEKMFERRFLMGCVSDFFYNLGYRTNKNAEHGQSVKVANKHIKEDGYNDEFDMLYHFSRYKDEDIQESVNAGFGTLDEEYIEKCERLYKVMIKDRRKDGFVPLYIDSRTGAGIYIIGCNRFHEESYGYSYRKKDDVCFVCVINFLMLDFIDPECGVDKIPLEMNVEKLFRSVKKAFDYFIGFISENESYKNYPYENDDELPQKIDEEFNLFFISKTANAEREKTAWENDYERRINARIEEKKKMEKSVDKGRKM
ncbi:MAG: hypothetical protein IJZ72_03375 [Oscillospiraceae bacterium]|nr:hypothetical protein [Oscillospiraceae bacterium]